MTLEDFSNSFDTLLNSYNTKSEFGEANSRQDIVLDEYEKSIFLTQAQKEIVTELYNGKNYEGLSFESTEEVRRYLSNLIRTEIIYPISDSDSLCGLSDNSTFFELPSRLMFITHESAYISDSSALNSNNSWISVYPVKQDSLSSIKNNPFRESNKRRVLRLDLDNNIIELISKYNISEYKVRYILEPPPIILIDLGELKIEGESSPSECKLNPALHNKILKRAVQNAILSRLKGGNK